MVMFGYGPFRRHSFAPTQDLTAFPKTGILEKHHRRTSGKPQMMRILPRGGPGRLLELQELARRSQNVAISISDPPPPTQPSQTAALTASHSSKPLYPPDHRLSLIVHPHTAGLPGRHRRALAGARIGHFHVPRGPMVCTPPAPRLTPTNPQS